MKKVIAILMALMVCAMPLISLASQSKDPLTRYVYTGNTGKLNVRSSMHTHSNNVIAKLQNGAEVVLLAVEGSWTKIEFTLNKKVVEGYVQSRYLSETKKASPAPQPTTKPSSGTTPATGSTISFKNFKHVTPYTVTTRTNTPGGFVNLRWAPSTDAKVMEKVYSDAKLTVIAENSTWAQVWNETNGHVGFMKKSFLQTAAK